MAAMDNVIQPLDLPGWAKQKGLTITTQRDCEDRLAFKNAVFTEVDAGITGAVYGFAESGTLCLTAGRDMPRLTSLAPIVHIAVLPVGRLVPSYEHMADDLFGQAPPSQVIMITGPSMTGDIQAIPFKGMHGPRRLIVILRDD
jgi:L-lactate dehydrogenase complex protein LldG